MSYHVAIFDFDYTLADSSAGVIDCVNHSLLQMKLTPATEEEIRKTIGLSLSETYSALTGRRNVAEAQEFRALFATRADHVMLENTVIFGSAKPCITSLLGKGMRLGIATSKFRYRIEAFLEREGLASCFEAVVGAEDVAELKPSPASIKLAIEMLHSSSREAVCVGDTVIDAQAAALAGVPFVAVLTGMTGRKDFKDHETLAVINDLTQLSTVLEGGNQDS